MNARTTISTTCFLLSLVLAGPALAQAAEPAATPREPAKEAPFAAAKVAPDDALEQARAREDLSMVAQSEQSSNVSNNNINGPSTTGEIRIGDNAFQNATGMTIINANSGNNVAMNASINVNIIMSPPQQ